MCVCVHVYVCMWESQRTSLDCAPWVLPIFFWGGGGDDVVVWRVVRQGLSLADLELTSSLNWLAQ